MKQIKLSVILPFACIMLATGAPATAQDTFGGGQRPAAVPGQPMPPPARPEPSMQPAPRMPPAPPEATPAGERRVPQTDAGGASSPSNELQDYGVQPTAQLHTGAMHGPTPVNVPGGRVVTTREVATLMRAGPGQYLLLDVLGGPDMLPTAQQAVWLAQPGTFDDATQKQAVAAFQQATGGRKDMPIILYCQSTQCWMSYNAALRAIAAGYTNVLWYRGGIEAWRAAGL
jgi:PQQ-dependent catabolism-associated CXXCW motif protein